MLNRMTLNVEDAWQLASIERIYSCLRKEKIELSNNLYSPQGNEKRLFKI
jgi:hypothetical protein